MLGSLVKQAIRTSRAICSQPIVSTRRSTIILSVMPWSGLLGWSCMGVSILAKFTQKSPPACVAGLLGYPKLRGS